MINPLLTHALSNPQQIPNSRLSFMMVRGLFLLMALAVWAMMPMTAHAESVDRPAGYESSYRLGAGDTISISVFGEEDLSMSEVRLNDAGSFSYPFLGEITAANLTLGQLERRIADGLRGDYLINPKVNVTIAEYREYFIYGEIRQPGSYPYQPNLTVRKAVAIAGGFTERAAKNKILVISETGGSRKDRSAALDEQLKPGDTVKVGQRFF